MINFTSFEYSILKYVHDTTTGEFINVGVVLYSAPQNSILAKCRNTISRLSGVFPDLNKPHFRKMMRFVNSQFSDINFRLNSELRLSPDASLSSYLHSVIPKDDSSLQWSEIRSGITSCLQEEIDDLFTRYVAKYDTPSNRERRTEQDIWRDFEKTLEAFSLPESFIPKKISVRDDELEFKHAWKNGIWHCIEPVSFDLSDGDYFKDKAHRWLGQMASIQDSKEEFKLYLLVSPPKEKNLIKAFENAVSILKKIPVQSEVFLEDDALVLASEIRKEMQEHIQSSK